MIFHVSIPALDPPLVSEVLAKLIGGRSYPFHAFPDGRIVLAGDADGTAIEVYSHKAELDIGETMVKARRKPDPSDRSSVHVAISTELPVGDIEAISKEAGWLCRHCDRGAFDLYEVWVEGRFLIEFFPPECQARYRESMTFDNWESWT